MIFGRSYIIGLVLQFLLGMAKERLSDPALKGVVKQYVYDVVPGKFMDPIAWAMVLALWDTLLAFAGAHQGNNSATKVAEGVASVSCEATEFLEQA